MAKAKKVKTETANKTRKVRTKQNGAPTNIMVARGMLLHGTTMKDIEKVTGDTSYAAIRQLEKEGYTFDKTQRDAENRIFYKAIAKAVPTNQENATKAA